MSNFVDDIIAGVWYLRIVEVDPGERAGEVSGKENE